jgi:hypothetical protein
MNMDPGPRAHRLTSTALGLLAASLLACAAKPPRFRSLHGDVQDPGARAALRLVSEGTQTPYADLLHMRVQPRRDEASGREVFVHSVWNHRLDVGYQLLLDANGERIRQTPEQPAPPARARLSPALAVAVPQTSADLPIEVTVSLAVPPLPPLPEEDRQRREDGIQRNLERRQRAYAPVLEAVLTRVRERGFDLSPGPMGTELQGALTPPELEEVRAWPEVRSIEPQAGPQTPESQR